MEICKYDTDIKRLIKQIDGNGQPGLFETVSKMSVKMDSLSENIQELSANVNELVKFQSEQIGVEKHELTSRQKATIIVTSILGVSGLIISLLNYLA